MNRSLRRLLDTRPDPVPTIARLALGIMILPHGLQKVFGWFGGYGFSATMQGFTEQMGIPWIFALAAVLAESLGGLALIIGVFSRLAALVVGIDMLVAALLVHLPNGFFMNWSGQQPGEGFEFHLLAFGLALVVIVAGGGSASVDYSLSRRART